MNGKKKQIIKKIKQLNEVKGKKKHLETSRVSSTDCWISWN